MPCDHEHQREDPRDIDRGTPLDRRARNLWTLGASYVRNLVPHGDTGRRATARARSPMFTA
jgi:hypothetical protein